MKRHERLKRVLEYLDDERGNWVKYNAKNLKLVSEKYDKLRFEMIKDLELEVIKLNRLRVAKTYVNKLANDVLRMQEEVHLGGVFRTSVIRTEKVKQLFREHGINFIEANF